MVFRSGGTLVFMKPSTLEQQPILFPKDVSLDAFAIHNIPASTVEAMANLFSSSNANNHSSGQQSSSASGNLTVASSPATTPHPGSIPENGHSGQSTPLMTPTNGTLPTSAASTSFGSWTDDNSQTVSPVTVHDSAHVYCAVHGLETQVHIYGYPSRRKLFSFNVPALAIASLDVSRDGNYLVLVTAGTTSQIMLYRLVHVQCAASAIGALNTTPGTSIFPPNLYGPKSPTATTSNPTQFSLKDLTPKLLASATLPVPETSPLDSVLRQMQVDSKLPPSLRVLKPVSTSVAGDMASTGSGDMLSSHARVPNTALVNSLKELALPVHLKGSLPMVQFNPFNSAQIVTIYRSNLTLWIVGPGSATSIPPALMPIDVTFPMLDLSAQSMKGNAVSESLTADKESPASTLLSQSPPTVVVAHKWVGDSRLVVTFSNGALYAIGVPSIAVPRAFDTTSSGSATEEAFYTHGGVPGSPTGGPRTALSVALNATTSATMKSRLASSFFSTEELNLLAPILSPSRKTLEARFVRSLPLPERPQSTRPPVDLDQTVSYSEPLLQMLDRGVRLSSLALCHRYLLVGMENDTILWLDIQTFETVFVQKLSPASKLTMPIQSLKSPAQVLLSRSYGSSIVSISFAPDHRDFLALSASGVLRRVVFNGGPANEIRLLSTALKCVRDAYVHHMYALVHSRYVELAAIGQDTFLLPNQPSVGEVEASILRMRNCRFPTLDENKLFATVQRLAQEATGAHGGNIQGASSADGNPMPTYRPTLTMDIIMSCAENRDEEAEADRLKASLFSDVALAVFPLANDPAFALYCSLPDTQHVVPIPFPPAGSPAAIRLERDQAKYANTAGTSSLPPSDGIERSNSPPPPSNLGLDDDTHTTFGQISAFAMSGAGVPMSRARASTSTVLVWSTMGPITIWSYSPRYLLDTFQLSTPKTAVAISKDATYAVVGTACGATHVLNISDVTAIRLVWSQRYHSSPIVSIAFNRDGDIFSVSSLTQTLFVRTADLNILGFVDHAEVLNYVPPSYGARTLAGLHTLVSALYRSGASVQLTEDSHASHPSASQSQGAVSSTESQSNVHPKLSSHYAVPPAMQQFPRTFAESVALYVLGMYAADDVELRIARSIDDSLAHMRTLHGSDGPKNETRTGFKAEQVACFEWVWGYAENEVAPERFLISTTKGRVIVIRPPNPFFQTSNADSKLQIQSVRPVATVVQCAPTAMALVPHSVSVHITSGSQLVEPISGASGTMSGSSSNPPLSINTATSPANAGASESRHSNDVSPAFVVLAGADRVLRVYEVLPDDRLLYCSSCAVNFASPIKSIAFASFSQQYSPLALMTVTCFDGSTTICSLLPGAGLGWMQPSSIAMITPTAGSSTPITSPLHSTTHAGRKGNPFQAGSTKSSAAGGGSVAITTPSAVVGAVPRIVLADPSDIVEDILETVVAAANKSTSYTALTYEPSKEACLDPKTILLGVIATFARGGSVDQPIVKSPAQPVSLDEDNAVRDLLRGQCAAHALAVYVALARVALASISTATQSGVLAEEPDELHLVNPALATSGVQTTQPAGTTPAPTYAGILSAASSKLTSLQQSLSDARASASAATAAIFASIPGLTGNNEGSTGPSANKRVEFPAATARSTTRTSGLGLEIVGVASPGTFESDTGAGGGDPTKDLLQDYLSSIANSPSGGVGYLINDRATNSAIIRPFAYIAPHTYARAGRFTAAFGLGGSSTNASTSSSYAGATDTRILMTAGPDGAVHFWDVSQLLQLPLYLLQESMTPSRLNHQIMRSARVAYALRAPAVVKPAMLDAFAVAASSSAVSAAVSTTMTNLNSVTDSYEASQGIREATYSAVVLIRDPVASPGEKEPSSTRWIGKRESMSRVSQGLTSQPTTMLTQPQTASLEEEDSRATFVASARLAHNTGQLQPREELQRALETFRRTFDLLMKANDAASPIERVDILEFAVDTELVATLRKRADEQVEATAKAIQRDILASQLMAHRIRQECVDSMETTARLVLPVTPSALAEGIEAHSFPVRKDSDAERLRGRRIEFLRRMEILDARLRRSTAPSVAPNETEASSSALSVGSTNPVVWSPEKVAADSTCVLNANPASMRMPWDTAAPLIAQVLKDRNPATFHAQHGLVNTSAAAYGATSGSGTAGQTPQPGAEPSSSAQASSTQASSNAPSGAMVPSRGKVSDGYMRATLRDMHYHPLALATERQKRTQIYLSTQQILAFKREYNAILEELAQQKQLCIEIVAERMKRINKIREELGVTGPNENISLDPRERLETIFEVQEHEIKSERYLSRKERELRAKREAEEAARRLQDSGPERALFEMMGGSPEASKQRTVLALDVVREPWMDEIPEDKMNEQQQAEYAAYLKKVKRFNEEQERRRKLLTTELTKLTLEIAERKKSFDEQVRCLSKIRTFYVKAIRQQELILTQLAADVFTHFNHAKHHAIVQRRFDLVSQERVRLNRLNDELRQQFDALRLVYESDAGRVKELERPLRTVAPPEALPYAEALMGLIRNRPQIPALLQHFLNFISSKEAYSFFIAARNAAIAAATCPGNGSSVSLVHAAGGVVSVLAAAAAAAASMQGGSAGAAAAANAAIAAAAVQSSTHASAVSQRTHLIAPAAGGKQRHARRASIGSTPYNVALAEHASSGRTFESFGFDLFVDMLRRNPGWPDHASYGCILAQLGKGLFPTFLHASSPSVPRAVDPSRATVSSHSHTSSISGALDDQSVANDGHLMVPALTNPSHGGNTSGIVSTPNPTASLVYHGLVLAGVAPATLAATRAGSGPAEYNTLIDPVAAQHGFQAGSRSAVGDAHAFAATSAGGALSSLSPYPPAALARPAFVGLAQELLLRYAGLVPIQACIAPLSAALGANTIVGHTAGAGALGGGAQSVLRGVGGSSLVASITGGVGSTGAGGGQVPAGALIPYSSTSSIHATIPPFLGRVAMPMDPYHQPALVRSLEPARPADMASDDAWNWFLNRYRTLIDLEQSQLRRVEELLSIMYARYAAECASRQVSAELAILERARNRLTAHIQQCERNSSVLLLIQQGFVELSQSPLIPDLGASLLAPRVWVQNLNEQILNAGSGIEGILSAIVKLHARTKAMDEEITKKDRLITSMAATRTELQVKRYNKQQQQDIKRGIDLNRTREIQSLNNRIQHLRDSDNERERAKHALHQKLLALAQQRKDENKRLEIIVQQLETAVRERMQISVIRADQLLGGSVLKQSTESKQSSKTDATSAAIMELSDSTLIDRALKALDDDVVAATAPDAYMVSPAKRATRPSTASTDKGSLGMVSGLLGLVKNSPGQLAVNTVESKKMKDVTLRRKLVDLAKLQGEEVRFLREQVEILRRRTFASFTSQATTVDARPFTSPASFTTGGLGTDATVSSPAYVAPRVTSYVPPSTAAPALGNTTDHSPQGSTLANSIRAARRAPTASATVGARGRPATSTLMVQGAASVPTQPTARPHTRAGPMPANDAQAHSLPPIFGSSPNTNSISAAMRAQGFGFAETTK